MKEDITKKLNVIQSRLDKGESIEELKDKLKEIKSRQEKGERLEDILVPKKSQGKLQCCNSLEFQKEMGDWKNKNFDKGFLNINADIEDGVIVYRPKLSSLIGKLSKSGAKEMRNQIKALKKEWER